MTLRDEVVALRDEIANWAGADPSWDVAKALRKKWAAQLDTLIARLPPAETGECCCWRYTHMRCLQCPVHSIAPPPDALRAGLPAK